MTEIHSLHVMGLPSKEYDALPWPEEFANGTKWKTLRLDAGGRITFFPEEQ
jgi:hypothetical protein